MAAILDDTATSDLGPGTNLPASVARSYMEALQSAPGGNDPTHPRGMLAFEIGSQLRVAELSGRTCIDLTSAVREVISLCLTIDEVVIDLRNGHR